MYKEQLLDAYQKGKLSTSELKQKLHLLIDQTIKSPLSENQKGLWLWQKMFPESAAYNVPLCFRLSKKLNTATFLQAFRIVLKQYPILTSVIKEQNKEPYQVFESSSPLFSQEDISFLSPEEIIPFLKQRAREFFILDRGPLNRIYLFSRKDSRAVIQEQFLLITIHHIIFDGDSFFPFLSTLFNSYQALIEGRNLNLKKTAAEYLDFVEWEQEMLQGSTGRESELYWKGQFSGDLPILGIPTDRPRNLTQDLKKETYFKSMSVELSECVKAFARSIGVNTSIVFLSVLKILLFRYTGQEDIIIGMPSMGRSQERFESLIGHFINMIPIRTRDIGKQNFSTFVKDLQFTVADGLDHGDYPFPIILRELKLTRGVSANPLVQAVFAYQLTLQSKEFEQLLDDLKKSLSMELMMEVRQEGGFEFELEVLERWDKFSLNMKYSPDLFDAATITRMMDHYIKLTEEMVNNPDLSPGQYLFLSKQEQEMMLIDWNRTEADYPKDKCIHELFEEQVEKNPDHIAVIFEGSELTYKELNEKANILGNYLRDTYQIGPDDLVGVMLERSEKIIIALLGILKSGGAYVPIDVEYPEERIKYMIEDSKPSIIVSEKDQEQFVDINRILKESQNKINPKTKKRATKLAYVIYTSGSTGKPKGIAIKQHSIVNYISWAIKYYLNKSVEGNFCLFTSVSFDLTITSVFVPLLHGKKIRIFDHKKDITSVLYEIFNGADIDCVKLTPSHITLLKEFNIKECNIKLVIVGGEALLKEHVRIIKGINKNITLINEYGPTETTVGCTVQNIIDADDSILIGKPISNTKAYILDHNLKLLPIGVPGELCISGLGLARGYLNRSEMTAEKFVGNSFRPGERMYLTGDRARWREDGNIEFLGRIDNQVKIRGFRIELGEIEDILVQNNNIDAAVVIVKEDKERNKVLAAYYVSEKELQVSELRSLLGKTLPNYMIPSYFIRIDEIPLSPSGKINGKVLPDPKKEGVSTGTEYVAPENKIEEKLIEIWKEILEVETVGVLDNFFELGGHSLKATRFISRINRELESTVMLRDIFNHPTISDLCRIIKGSTKKEYKKIEPVAEQEIYDVSNAQKRLWVLEQFEKEITVYNMPGAFMIEGKLDEDIILRTFSFIIERHESLRTVFVNKKGRPMQKIKKNIDYTVEMIDLTKDKNREEKAKQIAEKETLKPFNLGKGPLFRFSLISLEEEKYLMLINMHHIISDGWSINIFVKEFVHIYNCLLNNRKIEIEPLRIHYKDYAAWQNELLKNQEMEDQRNYWHGKLSGEIPVLDIPTDHIRPASKTFNGSNKVFIASQVINAGLNTIARENEISLFMLLVAVVKILLHKYTGQEDIIIGSPIAGRIHEDLEDQIGFYINIMVLRDTIQNDLGFKDFLKSVKNTCTSAFDNQNYPFDRLVEELDLKKDLSRSPFFDVMLTLQINETAEIEIEGLKLSPYKVEYRVSKFDLIFDFSEVEEGLYCRIEYNTDIYHGDRIERMIKHLETLMESIIKNSEALVSEIQIMPDEEKHLLLNKFNNTKTNYKTIIQLFEEQTEKIPGHTAIVFEGTELTYRELNKKANQLAHYLSQQGVKPDDLVGLYMERSLELIISILGILKSGGAYVPLDPDYPSERMKYILEDSGVKVVICQSELLNQLPISGQQVITSDNMVFNKDGKGRFDENPVIPQLSSHHLAYVIYTSGSTGKPKGVMVEHRQVTRLFTATEAKFQFSQKDVWTLFHSFAFDFSVWEIWGALIYGGKLVVVPKRTTRSFIDFYQLLVKEKVTILNQTPTAFNQLTEVDRSKGGELSLREIIFGGEALNLASLKPWVKRHGDRNPRLINMYGITETTVHVTYRRIRSADILENRGSMIGQPISDLTLYILDKQKEPTPMGVTGEIYVGGAGVARGYLNRKGLTRKRFTPSPFVEGDRLYRTGDLGRYLENGDIEYKGRMDLQVKIRGFRIELGEIESILAGHKEVNDVVVLDWEDQDQSKQLAAYVASDLYGKRSDLVEELRKLAEENLAEYMVPSVIMILDSMPLTANGKVDRKALPEPDLSSRLSASYEAPRSETEKKLCEVWQEVLSLQSVGVTDNFFTIGGDSIRSISLVAKAKKRGVHFTVDDLYSHPMISELSQKINHHEMIAEDTSNLEVFELITSNERDKLNIERIEDAYPLSMLQQGMIFHNLMTTDLGTYHDVFSFHLKIEWIQSCFEQALLSLTQRHETLRTVFQMDGDRPLQMVYYDVTLPLTIIDISHLKGEQQSQEIDDWLSREKSTGFDLSQPLWKVIIHLRHRDEFQFTLSFHHALLDGWSLASLHTELFTSYARLMEGKSIQKSNRPLPYKHFIALEQQAMKSLESREYWSQKLSGIQLPWWSGDKKRSAVYHECRISPKISQGLLDLARYMGVQEKCVLLAAHMSIMSLLGGTQDVVSSVVTNARPEVEGGEATLGLFLNSLPIRIDHFQMTWKELIQKVNQELLDQTAHRRYPLASIQNSLGLDFSASIFNYVNFHVYEQMTDDFIILGIQAFEEVNYIYYSSFSKSPSNNRLSLMVAADLSLFDIDFLNRVEKYYHHIFSEMLNNINGQIGSLELLSDNEKKKILYDFNNTSTEFPKEKTLIDLFEEQVIRTPDQKAVKTPIDFNDIYLFLKSENMDNIPFDKINKCCFKKNIYLYQAPIDFSGKNDSYNILKTIHHNSVIVNEDLLHLIDLFDGNHNTGSICSSLINTDSRYVLYSMAYIDGLETSFEFNSTPDIFIINNRNDFLRLLKILYNNKLIELTGIRFIESKPILSSQTKLNAINDKSTGLIPLKEILFEGRLPVKADVLLLGDTPGFASTGLLYLGSFLKRNGIDNCCQFYDPANDYESTKKNILRLLEQVQPNIVAISLKWFLYITRVLDICRVIKNASSDIKIVVGGNTASYYCHDMIKHECIDYVIRGDGEIPLLKLCQAGGQGEADIPNCLYKTNGTLRENPITYIQDQDNSSEIYLSHLDQIIISNKIRPFGSFFIYSHRGCNLNCFYCGGCHRVHFKTFNRKTLFKREPNEIKKDILAVQKYTSTFQFEFYNPKAELEHYCHAIFDGVDVSSHFCIFNSIQLPAPEVMEFFSTIFKYVYYDLEICTLSEKHRQKLVSLNLVKPQPTNKDIIRFFDTCEPLENVEVRVNLINGLPKLEVNNLAESETFLNEIMGQYKCFGELHWARLHAQPGATLSEKAEAFGMESYAENFDGFKQSSANNFNRENNYPRVDYYSYPYIYFKDNELNSKTTQFYSDMEINVSFHKEEKRKKLRGYHSLTYKELDKKATDTALSLKNKGLSSNQVIGLMADPCLEMIIGILAAAKAGCAFLPIDPGLPANRIAYMLNDCEISFLFTTTGTIQKSALATQVKDNHNTSLGFEIIYLDQIGSTVSGEDTDLKRTGQPNDPVYVVFTSGSTGKPKGVVLKNRGLVNYINWLSRTIQLTESDNSLLTSSFAFDLGYTSIFPALCNGSELHLIPKEYYLNAEKLLDYIKENKISYLKMTPSLFSTIINSAKFSTDYCSSLRWVIMGGESINMDDIHAAHKICRDVRFMNHYGPTETTIGSIAHIIDFKYSPKNRDGNIIGKPIDNTNALILDKNSKLLPVNVPGELCISGFGLANGYYNRPGLTAKKVVSNPYLTGQQMYKTGDLARWLPSGDIEFLGRIDTQVKIRGYRIELGEIEKRLSGHPDIEQALIVHRNDRNGNNHLCAYFTSKNNGSKGEKASSGFPEKLKLKYREIKSDNIRVGDNLHLSLIIPDPGKQKPDSKEYSIVDQFENMAGKNPDGIVQETESSSLTYDFLNRQSNQLAKQILQKYDNQYCLSKMEKKRYQRQMLLHGWGIESQEKLKSTTVFVAGAGGGASPTITQLALAGFGTIIVCDYDEVELSNLNRQFLHDESRIGMNKAQSAAMTINRLNPHVNVVIHEEKMTRENVFEMVGDSAIIFDMLDDLTGKFILSECATIRGIPHIISAMTELSSYTVIFHTPHTPCFHCLYDKEKYDSLARINQNIKDYRKNPLHVVSSTLFVSTGFAVTEALKIILGFDHPAYNKYFFFNQKASHEIVNTDGYRMMTYAYSEHFLNLCQKQGFDWKLGWRDRFLEELEIEPNPKCTLCSKDISSPDIFHKPDSTFGIRINGTPSPIENPQTIALLLDPDQDLPIGLLGVLKTNKTYVFLQVDYTEDDLIYILNDSEARVIVTNDQYLNLAEDLRNRVNKNIQIININGIDGDGKAQTMDLEINPDKVASIIYSPASSDLLNSEQLIEYLSDDLPEYMIPSYFIPLDKMPLLANGKIDRQKLPEPETVFSQTRFVAPESEMEFRLVKIWADLLDIDQDKISVEDNFFELGGHSLKVTLLVSKIYQDIQITISLADIFNFPTISKLSKCIENINMKHTVKKEENMVLLREGHDKAKHFFMVHAGAGGVEQYIELSNHLNSEFNCWGIKSDRIPNYTPQSWNLKNIVQKYIKQMKAIQPQGPYFISGWCLGGVIAFEMVRRLENSGEEIEFFGLINSYPPHIEFSENYRFNLQEEAESVLKFLPDYGIESQINNVSELNQVWPMVLENLPKNESDLETIKGKIPTPVAQATPNFDQADLKEVIYYLNMIRTIRFALDRYTITHKLKSLVYFFSAGDHKIEDLDRWNDYCDAKIKTIEIAGDHFSIFKEPHVFGFAKYLNNIIGEKKYGEK